MSCQVRRLSTGEISEVKAKNDEDSKLYKDIEKDVIGLNAPSKNILRERLKPWVGTHIKNLSSDKELALGLYKQTYSPNFKDEFGDWTKNPAGLDVDTNGEPKLDANILPGITVRQYLFNGEGRASDALSSQDTPEQERIPATHQVITSQIVSDNMKPLTSGDVRTSDEKQNAYIDNYLASKSNLSDSQLTEARATIDSRDTPSYKILNDSFSKMVDKDGILLAQQPQFDEPLAKNLQERLQLYPADTIFKFGQTIGSEKIGLNSNVDLMAIVNDDGLPRIDFYNFQPRNFISEDVDLNTPWYIDNLYKNKLNDTRNILIANGVDPNILGKMEAIPIQQLPDTQIIGTANPIMESNDSLLPITIPSQKTNDPVLDKIVATISAQSKLTGQSFRKALQHLQVKYAIDPILRSSKSLTATTNEVVNDFNNIYKDKNFSFDTQDEFNDYYGKLANTLDTTRSYVENLRGLGSNPEVYGVSSTEINGLIGELGTNVAALEQTAKAFAMKQDPSGYINTPEVAAKWDIQYFTRFNQLPLTTAQVLYKAVQEANSKADRESAKRQGKLRRIFDEAKKQYGSEKNMLPLIMDKESFKFHSKIDKQFYKDVATAIKGQDFNWLKENTDINAIKDRIGELKDQAIANATSQHEPDSDSLHNALTKIDYLYDTSSDKSNGWFFNADVAKSFPQEDKWLSDEYKTLQRPENKPAFDLYNEMIDYNKRAQQVGYLPTTENSDLFIPYKQAAGVEMAAQGKMIRHTLDSMLGSIVVPNYELDFGEVDPISQEQVRKLPRPLRNKIDNPSMDITSGFMDYMYYVELYHQKYRIENLVRNLNHVEALKGTKFTDAFGRWTGSPEDNPINHNVKLLQQLTDTLLYNYSQDKNNGIGLGSPKRAIKLIGRIEDKLGMKLIDDKYKNSTISLARSIDTLTQWTRFKTLALNPLSAMVNYLGTNYQALVNSGKFFTGEDVMRNEFVMMKIRSNPSSDFAKTFRAELDYFGIGEHAGRTKENRKATKSKLSSESIYDFFNIGLAAGDRAVKMANWGSIRDNMILVDGALHNAYDYYDSLPETQDRYNLSPDQRDILEKQRRTNVQKLKDQYHISNFEHIVDDNLVIDGLKDESSITKQIALYNDTSAKAIGFASDYNKVGVNLTFLGRSVMLYKNWILPLYETRFGSPKLNGDTNDMEWGRVRTVWKLLSPNLFKSVGKLVDFAKANERGVEGLKEYYTQFKADYERKTGKVLNMNSAEFFDTVRTHIRSTAKEAIATALLTGTFLAAQTLIKHEREQGAGASNQAKYFLRALDRLQDEASYFYNPNNVISLLSTGVFPAAKSLNQVMKVGKDFLWDSWSLNPDGTDAKKPHNAKDVMKLFPVVNTLSGLIPLFSEQLGKDLGIQVNYPTTFTN